MVAKVGAKFRLSFIAHNSISTVKYAKIVFLCFSEEKEKGGSFSSVADLHKVTSKTFLLKAQHHREPVWNGESGSTDRLTPTVDFGKISGYQSAH